MATNDSRILIIDDEPAICWGFRKLFESEGYVVAVASSVEQGLQLTMGESFDLVVMDVRLPGMDGISAIPLLQEATENAPVIIMTAFGDLETAVGAVRRGAADYLTKPFSLDEAVRVCKQALASRRSGSVAGAINYTRQ